MGNMDLNGIVNVLKPPGMTSFDVVGYLRKVFKIKRIGHTGTLDPGAVGVLPVCIGSATKAIEFVTEKDKLYRAELTLGVSTDTQDSSGAVIGTGKVNASEVDIMSAVQSFIGKISQIPPMYSAVKIDGKRLYELARNGITVERKAREIEIYSIDIINIKGNKIIMDVECSKGTYIRTLCSDIGDKLGCGGHMSFLARLKSGPFEISQALTVEEIDEAAQNSRLSEILTGTDTIFEGFINITLSERDEKKLLNGMYIDGKEIWGQNGDMVKVFDAKGHFISIAEIVNKNGALLLKSKKVF